MGTTDKIVNDMSATILLHSIAKMTGYSPLTNDDISSKTEKRKLPDGKNIDFGMEQRIRNLSKHYVEFSFSMYTKGIVDENGNSLFCGISDY